MAICWHIPSQLLLSARSETWSPDCACVARSEIDARAPSSRVAGVPGIQQPARTAIINGSRIAPVSRPTTLFLTISVQYHHACGLWRTLSCREFTNVGTLLANMDFNHSGTGQALKRI